MFEFLKNPIFKLLGVILVLYFGLFYDKSNPDSLGNIVDPENLKSEIVHVKEKSNFIIGSVNLARQLSYDQKRADLLKANKNLEISSKEIKIGDGPESLECGDEASFSYIVYDAKNKPIQVFNSRKFTLKDSKNQMINHSAIGMKVGGVRSISIPYGIENEDKELIENLRFAASNIKYEITLLSIIKKQATSC